MKLISLRKKHKRIVKYFLAIVATLIFSNVGAEYEVTDYQSCLGNEYSALVTLQKEYDELKNENFQSYRLEGWEPTDKTQSDAFEQLCKLSDVPNFPTWLDVLCKTYDFGQAYNKTAKTVIMNGVSFLPDRGVNNIYRNYLINNKELCENPVSLPKPTGYEIYLPAETKKDKGLISLLMYKGWKQYCDKVLSVKKQIDGKKELCVVVPDVRDQSLLNAGVKLELLALKYTHNNPVEFSQDPDKAHWMVHQQQPLPGTLMRRFIRNNVDLTIRKLLTKIQLTPGVEQQLKPGEMKQIKAEAFYQPGSSMDITANPSTRWTSSDKSIATIKNGLITVNPKAPGSGTATLTAKFTHFGITQSAVLPIRVKAETKLKEIVLEAQNSIHINTLPETKIIKAFAVYTDDTRKEITRHQDTDWILDDNLRGSPFDNLDKGELYLEADFCSEDVTVTVSYQSEGKSYLSKPLKFKIHPDYVFSPWLVGEKKNEALRIANDLQFKTTIDYEPVFKRNFGPEEVTLQDPQVCDLVKKGTKLSLLVNPDVSGKMFTVPDLIGRSSQQAADMLGKQHLFASESDSQTYTKEVTVTVGGKTETRQIKPSHIVSQSPDAGTKIKPGATVNITLNYHRIPKLLKVPDLVGMPVSNALTLVSKMKLGLNDSFSSAFDSRFNAAEIISQQPAQGAEVAIGSTINVIVNPAQPQQVSVPDLLCMTEADAMSLLTKLKLGIQPNVASSHDPQCEAGEIIEQTPKKNTKVPEGTSVGVLINPVQKALIGIAIQPVEKRSYPLNTELTFKENVTRKSGSNQYRFVWYLDGDKKSNQNFFKHKFDKPGIHYVMLDMISSDPTENDSISAQINIEYPVIKETECQIRLEPSQSSYKEGARITFIGECTNTQGVSEYRWYIDNRHRGSGKRFSQTFDDQGEYKVKLGLRRGSNVDEVTATTTINIGSGIGVLGNKRNRFKATGGLKNLSVCSEYFVGGLGKWSPECATVSKIGGVDGYKLCTGGQSDGHNSGWLIYRKNSSQKLNFQVYKFDFNRWKGVISYSGTIPETSNPDIDSLNLSCRSNVADIGWNNEDGSSCSTKIWKHKTSQMIANYGVETPVCSEPLVGQKKLRYCNTFAQKAVDQFNENINRQCNLTGPEWHDDEAAHKKWCLDNATDDVDRLTQARADALKQCGKNWCDAYAQQAVEHNESNLNNGCGYTGQRWQSNYQNHLGWCQNNTKKAANSETQEREKMLKRCVVKREGSCQDYASKAVEQNNQNLKKDCGYCGERWQSNYDNHYQWCLSQKQPARDTETKSRETLLGQCQGVSNSGKRTFFEPCYNNYRLDNCLKYKVNSTCKKPAADKFCQSKGYKEASQFPTELVRPTLTMDDNQVCDDTFCAGFSSIECRGHLHPQNEKPTCRIKQPRSAVTVMPGRYIHFLADAKDPDRDKLTYSWAFEGGRPETKSSQVTSNAISQWNSPGIYTATLTVTDNKGGSCVDTVAITVQEQGNTFDCSTYAVKSVSQNDENVKNKCGFSGALWHSSKAKHLSWCSSGRQSIAPRVVAERDKALKECRDLVVISTGDLNCEITKPSKLAFTNAGVPVDFAGSAQGDKLTYSWQFDGYQTNPASSNMITPGKVTFKWPGSYKALFTVTDAAGKSCQASRDILVHDSQEPREFCESYATLSVAQNAENKKKNCGLSGAHWHDNELNHQKWCDSVSFQQARDGLTSRDEALRKCSGEPIVVEPPQPIFNLAGSWVDKNGHKVNITQSGLNVTSIALENKGPVGWKTAPGELKKNEVHMDFNGWKLTGNVSSAGNSITWSNNSIWTRVSSSSGVDIIDSKSTFSCKQKDNEEKGCCCFKGAHTYLFAAHQVKNIHTKFDTGKRFNCKSTVKLDIKQNDTWKTIKQIQANSSSNGKELNPIDVVVPINAIINGFRISDGCVCCIDDSSISIDGKVVPGVVKPQPVKPLPTPVKPKPIKQAPVTLEPDSPKPEIVKVKGKMVLAAVADSHVYAYSYLNWNKSNWGKYSNLGAGWHPAGGEKRTFLKFDLSGIDQKSFKKAILKLYHTHTGGGNAVDLGVYKVSSPWKEGRGTYKPATPAKPDEITWVHQPTFDTNLVATFNPGTKINKQIEVDITELVKSWLSGMPNHGLVIKSAGILSHSIPESQYGFLSRENKDETKRPTLILFSSNKDNVNSQSSDDDNQDMLGQDYSDIYYDSATT